MVKILILYLLTFLLLVVSILRKTKTDTIISVLIFFQICLFFNPLKRSLEILVEKASWINLLILLVFAILGNFLILRARQKPKKSYFFRLYLFVLAKIEHSFKKLTYLNQHSYYIANKFFPLLEKKVRPYLKNPTKILFLLTFFFNLIIFFIAVIESYLFSSISLAIALFIFNIFLFKIIKIGGILIKQISKNSVSFNFSQAMFNLYLPKIKDLSIIKMERLFYFLERERLDKVIYLDKISKETHLADKFLIIFSILHFSSIYFLIQILDKYLIFYYRLISNIHLFFSILFFLLVQKLAENTSIKYLIFFDASIFFLFCNFLFFYNFIFVYRPYPEVTNLFRKLTYSIPKFLEEFKTMLIQENLVVETKLVNQPRSIFVKEIIIKPDFLEGFNEIPYEEKEEKQSFPWRQFFKFIWFLIIISFSYFLIDILIKVSYSYFAETFIFYFEFLSLMGKFIKLGALIIFNLIRN